MPTAIGSAALAGHRLPAPLPARGAETVSSLYLSAMREHDRKSVMLHWSGDHWEDTPDWRLDRQVIRLGLYLRERAGVGPGERVVILSPLRREWLLADWSASAQGAAAVAIDPDIPAPALAAALDEIAPRAAFVSDRAALERLEAVPGGAEPKVIAFEGPVPPGRAVLLSEALDLGGTLDTPERAGAFRAQARDVSPEARALGYLERGAGGPPTCRYLLHREVMARLGALGRGEPRRGDLAYVAAPAVTVGVRLALIAFMGDGHTTAALGTPGRELAEIDALDPHEVVAPAHVLEAAMSRAQPHRPDAKPGWRSWLERAARLAPRARRASGGGVESSRDRPRWLRSTAALDAAGARRDVAAMDLEVGPEELGQGGAM